MGGKPRVSYKRTVIRHGQISGSLSLIVLSCNHAINHHGPVDEAEIFDCQGCRYRDQQISYHQGELDRLNEEKHRNLDNS